MKGAFVCALAVVSLCGVFTQNPGAQYRVTEEGLNWGIKTGLGIVDNLIVGKEMPTFGGTFNTIHGNEITYEVRKLKIVNYNAQGLSMSVGNGDVTTSGNGFGGKMTGEYSFTYEKSIVSRTDDGTFDLDFNVDMVVTAGTTADQNGRPFITMNDCLFALNAVDYELTGDFADEHREVLDDLIERADETCDGLSTLLNQGINPLLAKTPMQVAVPKVGVFDFHLTIDPVAANSYIEAYHKAQFFGVEDFNDPPFEAAPFPMEPTTHMVTLWASDFVANSFFYVVKEQLKIEVTPELLGDFGDYLKIKCDSLCFGIILPQEVADKYPNGFAVIRAWVTEQPVLTFTPEAAKVSVKGQIQVYVRDNGVEHFLFSAETDVDGSAFLEMDGRKVKFEVKTLNARMRMIDNQVDGLEEDDLNMLIRLGVSTFIKPKLNEIGSNGFELPMYPDAPYSNPLITLYDHTIVAKVDGGL
ncbi:hypothetical protein CAPTEDRAFT_18671 [Capitella teleta]|uniref:Lipid-binding serum glycoprotein C-terminal domain-containing protein n=1 Tax=Capitella teleta TaxID=283909 RepID=R7T7K8_CAPTE|nr:hypothetical protein CAPTEDRAFT_18671 [Capitella teleta]|eukprot:ELT89595.1 hypothetical protein CAPTEDRAFT_18671 [Capitella teleta]